MKIGLFSYSFPNSTSSYNPGVETVIYNLAKHLSQKTDITVYTSSENGKIIEEDRIDNLRILRANQVDLKLGNLSQFYHSWKLIQKYRKEIEKEDVLHDVGSMLSLWSKSFKAPLVTTFHHYEPFKVPRDYFRRFPVDILIQKEKYADVVVTVSEYSKRDFIEAYSIKNKSIVVIPNGVDDSVFNVKVKPKFNKDNIILFVGQLSDRKGLIYLIKALPIIKQEIKDFKLLIVGKGPSKNKLILTAKKLKVEEHIEFIGNLSLKELPRYFRAATVFVFPTLKEGFGLVALESMACGTPVIASDIEPVKSIVADGGLFFKPGDHIGLAEKVVAVFKNKTLRKKLSTNVLKRAPIYSWKNIADQYLSLYRELIRR